MIDAMPRYRPRWLQREKTRHGSFVWYVRAGKGARIRLRATFGTEDFDREYQAAIKGETVEKAPRARSGSLLWLYEKYRTTDAWQSLASSTRRAREYLFDGVMETAGAEPFTAIKRRDIVDGRDRRADTPAQARNFLDAVRGLFRWALEAEHIRVDPTAGVSNPKRRPGAGFAPWTEEDVANYEARWPVGTKERVWLDVLLYTGLRRGDAVRFGRQHVRDGIGTIRTEKSGEVVTVTLPILPALAVTIAAGPCADLAFICGATRKPLTKESFGNVFREAAKEAGVSKSAHGVRKIGATRAAENGATVAELEAIFGWRGGGMASLYTKAADRARLAKGAMGKLVRTAGERSMPAPSQKGAGHDGNKRTKSRA